MRKRAAAVGLIASLVGILAFAALAPGAGTLVPTLLTAKLGPRHRLKAPYRFAVSGQLTYPTTTCAKGATKGRYCVKVGKLSCSGKVTITIQLLKDKLLRLSGQVVSTRTATMSSSCKYSQIITLRKAIFIANVRKLKPHAKGHYVGVAFFVTFAGNSTLTGKRARRQVVIAKVHAAG